MSVFTWTPDNSAQKRSKPAVSSLKFGDGYEQRAQFGLNQNPQIWNVKFENRTVAEIDAIEELLETCNGVDYFEWTPPRQAVALKFICREWNRTVENATYDSLTATFEQVYEP